MDRFASMSIFVQTVERGSFAGGPERDWPFILDGSFFMPVYLFRLIY